MFSAGIAGYFWRISRTRYCSLATAASSRCPRWIDGMQPLAWSRRMSGHCPGRMCLRFNPFAISRRRARMQPRSCALHTDIWPPGMVSRSFLLMMFPILERSDPGLGRPCCGLSMSPGRGWLGLPTQRRSCPRPIFRLIPPWRGRNARAGCQRRRGRHPRDE